MIEGNFDVRTLANMNVALDRVCGTSQSGERHEVRKRVPSDCPMRKDRQVHAQERLQRRPRKPRYVLRKTRRSDPSESEKPRREERQANDSFSNGAPILRDIMRVVRAVHYGGKCRRFQRYWVPLSLSCTG
jgi:hypothetical protein